MGELVLFFNSLGLCISGFVIAMQLRKASLPGGNKDRLFPWLCLMLVYFVAFYKYLIYG